MDLAVRAAGALVALWGAVLLAAIGAFLTPLRLGATLIPVSVLLAIVGNGALIWFAYRVTESVSDSGQLVPMVDHTREMTGRPLKVVLVDSGFGLAGSVGEIEQDNQQHS